MKLDNCRIHCLTENALIKNNFTPEQKLKIKTDILPSIKKSLDKLKKNTQRQKNIGRRNI